MTQLRGLLTQTRGELDRFRRIPLPMVFRFLPIWLLVLLCPTPLILQHFGIGSLSSQAAAGVSVGSFVFVCVLYFLAGRQAAPTAAKIAGNLGKARRLHDACFEKAEMHYQQETKRIVDEFNNTIAMVDQQLKLALKENVGMKGDYREKIDEKTVRISARNDEIHRVKLEQLKRTHTEIVDRLRQRG